MESREPADTVPPPGGRGATGLGPYVELLRDNPNFRRLWVAQLISLGGDWFASVALLGLIDELTGSSFQTGLVLAANMLPYFLLSPITGVLADRYDRKKLMIASDVVRAFLALGMLLARTPETAWIGIASLAALATFGSLFGPASQAALPNLVTPEQLPRANILMSSAFGTMLAVGSGLGGLAATYFGRDTTFLVNSVSFLFSGALILTVKGRFSIDLHPEHKLHPIRDIHEGIAYARGHPRVMALLATKGGFGLGAGLIALLPLFATDVFRAGDLGIGIMFAARGIGALLGPFGARAFAGNDEGRLFLAISGAMAVYGITYMIFPVMPSILAAAVVIAIAHLGGGAQWTMSLYGLQMLTPDRVRGRILAFDFGLVTLTMSASLLLAGRLAESADPRNVVVAFASVELGYALVWTLWTRKFWSRSRAPLAGGGIQPVGGEGAPPGE